MPPTTPIAEMATAVAQLRRTFSSNRTKALAWRKEQLTRLYTWLQHDAEAIAAVSKNDNGKGRGEINTETGVILNEIATALENLDEWASPEQCSRDLSNFLDKRVETRMEPMGVVLIIGAWNFPLQLTLAPLVAAIAAGCCVVLKPSEMAPATETLLATTLPKILDPSAIRVVTGGVPETTALLATKFDLIFYTGSGTVGKIVMTAAAKQLTPVVLELGGKSPLYVHEDANIEVAAKRLVWAKTFNCGQVCLAPDYALVHKKALPALLVAVKKTLTEFLTENPADSPDYARIVSPAHAKRLQAVLQRQLALPHSKLVAGGEVDAAARFVAPTVVSGVKEDDPLMEDEIFGPLLGVISVESVEEALRIINTKDRPLSLYIFSESPAVVQKIVDNTMSGTVNVNDFYLHMLVPDMPFGGCGASGIGAYHGKDGFLGKSFTHRRGFLLLYPPASNSKASIQFQNAAVIKGLPSGWFRVLKRVGWALLKLALVAIIFEAGRRVGDRGGWGSLLEGMSNKVHESKLILQ
ncbi:Aldehyde/histidinol dehydrogenase [Chytriomyces sp. MP71]|nr:Aldehyde/histidinol dehydrogenase [Chytriomyces sp. MP71]